MIPHSAGCARLLMADSTTICIAHTKNGTKGAVVHHDLGIGPGIIVKDLGSPPSRLDLMESSISTQPNGSLINRFSNGLVFGRLMMLLVDPKITC